MVLIVASVGRTKLQTLRAAQQPSRNVDSPEARDVEAVEKPGKATKLSSQSLDSLASRNGGAAVVVPTYDRTAVTAGIVHIGVGGFHRAHQVCLSAI